MDSQITEIKAQYESEKLELNKMIAQEKLKEDTIENERKIMAKIRHSNGINRVVCIWIIIQNRKIWTERKILVKFGI